MHGDIKLTPINSNIHPSETMVELMKISKEFKNLAHRVALLAERPFVMEDWAVLYQSLLNNSIELAEETLDFYICEKVWYEKSLGEPNGD